MCRGGVTPLDGRGGGRDTGGRGGAPRRLVIVIDTPRPELTKALTRSRSNRDLRSAWSPNPTIIMNCKPTRVPFRYLLLSNNQSTGVTSSASEIDLVPANLGARLADMADDFQKYRFTHLKLSILPSNHPVQIQSGGAWTGGEMLHAIAFDPVPSAGTGNVSGIADMAELRNFALSNGDHAGFSLGPEALLAPQPVKWFDTTATGTPPDSVRYQGTIYYYSYIPTASSTNFRLAVQVEGVCEFCTPVDPSDAVVLRRRLAKDQARLQLLESKEDHGDAASEADAVCVSRSAASVSAMVSPRVPLATSQPRPPPLIRR